MSSPPSIPPRRKKQLANQSQRYEGDYEGEQSVYDYTYDQQMNNSQRTQQFSKTKGGSQQIMYDDETSVGYSAVAPAIVRNLLDEQPETIIGKAVKVKGELSFERLLRVDGTFDGTLISKGDLVVGKTGTISGDIKDMGIVISEGKIIGSITVERVELRGKAVVHGNITCKSLKIDPTVVISGKLNVNPFAPALIDHDGNVINEAGEKQDGQPKPTTEK